MSDGKRMLLVDTCGSTGLVAVAVPGPTPVVVSARRLPGRETQERLMEALAEAVAEAGCDLRQVDTFAVVSGPGSFTGVRIGMAAVKGLAEACGKPLISISRLAVLATRSHAPQVACLLDAGRGDVYLGVYRAGTCLAEQMLPLAAALEQASGMEVLVCESSLFAAMPQGSATLLETSPEDVLRVAVQALEAEAFADTALADANYLRVPDAELALRASQGKL